MLDFRTALDNPVLVHPEDDWKELYEQGADVKRNLLCPSRTVLTATVEAVLADCDVVVDETYHTVANNQAMMETFRAYSYLDALRTAQHRAPPPRSPFHVRRIIATALGIPKSKVRVVKPRIGGGFGAKQTVECGALSRHCDLADRQARHDRLHPGGDPPPAAVRGMRWKSASRWARTGTAISGLLSMYTLSNAGAYGEHCHHHRLDCPATRLSLFTESWRPITLLADVVYTNLHARRRVPGLRRDPGHPRGGERGGRAGSPSWAWIRRSFGSRTLSVRDRSCPPTSVRCQHLLQSGPVPGPGQRDDRLGGEVPPP